MPATVKSYKSGPFSLIFNVEPGRHRFTLAGGPPHLLTDNDLLALAELAKIRAAELHQPTPADQVADKIQAVQNEIYDLYTAANLNLQERNTVAFLGGLLAWEAVRLFWYFFATGQDGGKLDYVLTALDRLMNHIDHHLSPTPPGWPVNPPSPSEGEGAGGEGK